MATSATLEVIDGQQRMTTISLLLAALYSKLLPYKKEDELSDDQMADFIALKKRLVKEKEKIPTAVLTLQNQNQNCDDYFCLLCNELKLLKDKPKIAYMGNRKIYTAYRYFISKIDEKIAELQEENPELDLIDAYFGLVKKFCSAVLVSIEVGNNKDAYMLFESLNNRGVPLSAMDLIKNCVIAKADNGGKIDECHEQWLRIIDNLTDEVNVQERFFRQYYNAFRDELNGEQPVEGKGKYRLGAALATARSSATPIASALSPHPQHPACPAHQPYATRKAQTFFMYSQRLAWLLKIIYITSKSKNVSPAKFEYGAYCERAFGAENVLLF